MSRDRIALLFATSGHSGVDRVVSNLVAQFAHADHSFDLLRIRNHGPWLPSLPPNVRDYPLRAAHRNTVLPALLWYLCSERPAALMTASHKLNRAALMARAIANPATRIAIRMGMTLSGQEEILGRRRSRRLFQSMRFWYPRADAVIAPSAGVGNDLMNLAGVTKERLHIIPNPLVTPELHRQAAESVRHPWFSGSSPPIILGVGSLEERKDFATLLRAFARLRQERPCRLVLLGEGRERQRLTGLAEQLGIANDMWLAGFVSNPYAYMSRAAVFALTSRREGSGAVIVEALACGTPTVSTDCPSGPAEILQGGKIGPLVKPGDDVALAEQLRHLLDNPPPKAGLRDAVKEFSAQTAAERYLSALGIAKPSKRPNLSREGT